MDEENQKKRSTVAEDAGRRVDDEVEKFIRWFNDDAVPSIRSHSGQALRIASTKLAELADLMDRNKEKS